jgi:hypothetical protein
MRDPKTLMASRGPAYRVGALVLAACLFAGCKQQAPAQHGMLVPVLDTILRAGVTMRCEADVPTPDFGLLKGCWGRLGDTLVYSYEDSSREIVLVGRQWRTSRVSDASTRSGLAAALTTARGLSRSCQHSQNPSWQIEDVRWQLNGYHIALLLMRPSQASNDSSVIRLVTRLGSLRCQDLYSVPLKR